jgi:hypothetical protein
MTVQLRHEFEEFLLEVKAFNSTDASLPSKCIGLTKEMVDVVVEVYQGLDSIDADQDILQLTREIEETVRDAADVVLASKPFALRMVKASSGFVAEALVEFAKGHTEPVEVWMREQLLPLMRESKDTLNEWIEQLSGHSEVDGLE